MNTKTQRRNKTQKLVISKTFRPPPPGPPLTNDVIDALSTQPSERTYSQQQILFRYLLLNKNIGYMFDSPEAVDQISKTATITILNKSSILFCEGDIPNGWYLIVDGSVDVVIRYFLIAEDCLFDSDIDEITDFAQLMDLMHLDVKVDKLKRIKTLCENDVFGQHSYYLDKRRSATIVGVSSETILMKFPESTLKNTESLIRLTRIFAINKSLIHSALPRLRDDQLLLINGFSEEIKVPAGRKITERSPLSNSLYIVKEGCLKLMRMVDFTDYSFRKTSATFESLQLHFPDGYSPVHIGDLRPGSIFADPSVHEVIDSYYQLHATTDCLLIALNFEYFKIVAGKKEVGLIREELRSKLSSEEVVRVWANTEKQRLWKNFKKKGVKDAHKELKTARRAQTSMVAIRIPSKPKSFKEYHPKKVVPYVSPGLR